MIKYGTIEYFELVDLQDKIKAWKWDKLDLIFLDRLRMEVNMKLKAIENEYTERIQRSKDGRLQKSQESNTFV